MLKFSQFLAEGRFDPGILKCVFMAGGPGSGKSFVAGELFGISPQFKATFSHYGLKSVNTDTAFEFLMHANGHDHDLSNLDKLTKLTVGPDSIRERAKRMTKTQLAGYVNGKLGLLIDGTGDDVQKIVAQRRRFEDAGYDTYMVFVNTPLETALERNRARPRKLPDDFVTQTWQAAQRNLDEFADAFGRNFLVIDNVGNDAELRALSSKLVARFITAPVNNPIGRQWMADLDAIAASY